MPPDDPRTQPAQSGHEPTLPSDLLTALRDPLTVLPGEGAVYGRVAAWVDAQASSTVAAWREPDGTLVNPRSDT